MTKKPVGLSHIDKLNQETLKIKKYYLNGKSGAYITYNTFFAESKIDELLIELFETKKKCEQEKCNYLVNDDEILKYTNFLIIKYFTSLYDELKNQELATNLLTMEKIYDIGLYNKLLTEVFDAVEIEKVIDKLYLMVQNLITTNIQMDTLMNKK